jgi:p-aminobenzoyl-glutamate transporter AbgT
VKAGVPIVADASKLGGDTPINPYFVSFLAIISGLMSEKGIASLRSWIAPYAI